MNKKPMLSVSCLLLVMILVVAQMSFTLLLGSGSWALAADGPQPAVRCSSVTGSENPECFSVVQQTSNTTNITIGNKYVFGTMGGLFNIYTWLINVNSPPNQPTNKMPIDGAIGVFATPTLISSVSSYPDTSDMHAASHSSSPAPGMLRMNMKSYGNHNPTYDSRILTIKPELVIDNPPHGLYGEMEEEQYPGEGYTATWLLQNVAGYQAAGIKVIGYITSGYEGRGGDDGYAVKWYSLEMNKKLITNMATLDHVDGVFIDECSDFPNAASKSYLQQLSNLAHSYGLIVWMNTGVDNFDEWYFTSVVADFMQSSEAWRGQSLSPVQQQWGSRIGVTGYKSSYTAQDAYNLTINAWCKGIKYCYINTVEYTSIAPWFEQYAQLLRNWDGSCPASGGKEDASEGEGCFIATAAYGSFLDSHVQKLRAFRDSYLLANPVGRGVVTAYYRISPPLAEFIDDHPSLKPIVRVALLPAVIISEVAVSTTSAEKVAILCSLALVSVGIMVWARKRKSEA